MVVVASFFAASSSNHSSSLQVLELAIEAGYIKQGGSWFTLQLPRAVKSTDDDSSDSAIDHFGDDDEEEEEEEPLKFQGMERLRLAVESDPVSSQAICYCL